MIPLHADLFLHAPAFSLLFFFFSFFSSVGFVFGISGKYSLAASPFNSVIYTGLATVRFSSTVHLGRQQGNLVQKGKICTLHLAAFAVNSFCWFSVVVAQSSSWLLAKRLHCFVALQLVIYQHRSSHINQHLHPAQHHLLPECP